MVQVKLGGQDEGTDYISLSPDTTPSPETFVSATKASPSQSLNLTDTVSESFIADYIEGTFKSIVQALPEPKEPSDLYEFESAVTDLLNNDPRTQLLLSPLGEDPGLRRLSAWIHSIIRARVSDKLVPHRRNRTLDTYELLENIRAMIPEIYHFSQYRTAKPPYVFPTRRKTETMAEYINRFWLWKDRYLPCEYPEVVYYLASCIWVNHSQLYETQYLSASFGAAVHTFKDTEEVTLWFMSQDLLKVPVTSPAKPSNANPVQGSRRGQTGNPNKQGSTHEHQHPVPANKNNGTHNTTNGNVNKNGNKNAKKFRKNSGQKKNQLSQAVSTDAGDAFTEMFN